MGFPVPYAPATDLVVYNETTTSLNARWNPAPGPVQNYRISYVPTSGGRPQTVSSAPTLLLNQLMSVLIRTEPYLSGSDIPDSFEKVSLSAFSFHQ